MNHAMVLDCTLRDGAYLIDKKFGDNYIRGIIEGLVKARIDCIEIGFFQDEGFGEGKTVFKNSADAKRFVPKDKNGSLFTVLADCSRYSVSNLDAYDSESIDGVRECFFKNERYDAIANCKKIIAKGYKCFVQPVDILGYSDMEIIELIQMVNEIEPYCLSIVDTFGSMYQDDLNRIFELINHNLIQTCRIGFHSHNNMQLSNALSQEFVRMTYGKRNVVVDGTISGMGRGAGNTPTELIAQYMVSKLGYTYDLDALLDIIDDYIDNIRTRCSWGYTTPFFVAGCFGAHVNNIAYLKERNSIRSKDIRYILNKIGPEARKRYDYDLLEQTYVDYLNSDIDDSGCLEELRTKLSEENILLMLPGSSIKTEKEKVSAYISATRPIVISVNFIPDANPIDYIYISNLRRWEYWKNDDRFAGLNKIIASNVKSESTHAHDYIISFNRLVKCGWNNIDNSALMLLRLLDALNVKTIAIAGFDGYDPLGISKKNYAMPDMELSNVGDNAIKLNEELGSMLQDYMETRKSSCKIRFITESRFAAVCEKKQ